MHGVSAPERSGENRAVVHLEAYGVRLEVGVEPATLIEQAQAVLPPVWVSCEDRDIDARFALFPHGGGYEVTRDGDKLAHGASLAVSLGVLEAQLRMTIATSAPRGAFVHAGVVSLEGRAIVLPGFSFAGKTTLVRALLEQGAGYLSDEFALLDEDGRVHPYAKALSLRAPGTARRDHADTRETHPSVFGAPIVDQAVPVGLIAALTYTPGSDWAPATRTPAQGALLLLSHALRGREDSERVLGIVGAAARDALVIEGSRGEAPAAAAELIALARAHSG
jgi:hypothetical protein